MFFRSTCFSIRLRLRADTIIFHGRILEYHYRLHMQNHWKRMIFFHPLYILLWLQISHSLCFEKVLAVHGTTASNYRDSTSNVGNPYHVSRNLDSSDDSNDVVQPRGGRRRGNGRIGIPLVIRTLIPRRTLTPITKPKPSKQPKEPKKKPKETKKPTKPKETKKSTKPKETKKPTKPNKSKTPKESKRPTRSPKLVPTPVPTPTPTLTPKKSNKPMPTTTKPKPTAPQPTTTSSRNAYNGQGLRKSGRDGGVSIHVLIIVVFGIVSVGVVGVVLILRPVGSRTSSEVFFPSSSEEEVDGPYYIHSPASSDDIDLLSDNMFLSQLDLVETPDVGSPHRNSDGFCTL